MRATDLAGAAEALELGRRSLVSLVGGGGKTTLLFALGRQLPARTLLTTTTRMGRDRTGGFPCLIGPTDAELALAFDQDDAVLGGGPPTSARHSATTPTRLTAGLPPGPPIT